jgi:hypothetical protein
VVVERVKGADVGGAVGDQGGELVLGDGGLVPGVDASASANGRDEYPITLP